MCGPGHILPLLAVDGAAVRAAGVVDMRGDGFRLVRRERQGRADGAGAPVGRGRRVRRSRGGHS